MPFNLEQAVADWRRQLRLQSTMEPEFIEELESGLHDRYEEYLIQGLSPEAAFEQARARVTPDAAATSQEYAKVNRRGSSPAAGLNHFFVLLPNYLKVGLRNLRRKKLYNAINFVCLSIGVLTTALALLYLDYETSYDDYLADAGQKYRLGRTFRSQDYSVVSFDGYFRAEPEVQMKQINGIRETRGVVSACQFFTFWPPNYITANDKKLPTEQLLQTNTPKDFFDFFGWPFLEGSAEGFAAQLNTAVLTAHQAERFFGPDWRSREVIGQPLESDDQLYTITGVIEDLPPNAHYDFSIALHKDKIDYWGSRTYIKTEKGIAPEEIERRLDENMPNINTRLASSELFGGTILQSVPSIHLNSNMLYELKPPGDKRYLYIIGIISGIILLLTISNYTNLSIAMNAGRSREIGMRKIFGATRTQVSQQFIMESLVLALLTLPVVAIGLWLLIPYFNDFMGTAIEANPFTSLQFWGFTLGTVLIVGLLASLYPSLFLAGQRIVHLFQGNLAQGSFGGFSTRKAIITFQFALLIGLCSLTLLVNQQLQYIQRKDLGFDQEQVLYVNLSEDSTKFEVFKNELLQLPEVTGVGSGSPLGRNPFNQTTYRLKGTAEVYDDAYDISLDYSAMQFLDIETSVPELIDNPEEAPKQLIIINETLVEKLTRAHHLSREELIGKTIIQEPEYTDEETGEVGFPFTIDGTFKDINMFSLRERITPMFLTVYKNPGYVRWASIGYRNATPAAIIEKVKAKYETLNLDKAFIHSFLSQNIEELYEQERRIAKLSIYFSLIAFLVAVIGLVALTAYLTTLKRKEIGIREILGAGRWDILLRFNREYFGLIGLALVVAAPLAYLGVRSWLSSFAYHIEVHPLVFVLAGGITLLISILAVSFMVLRALQALPVRALQEDQ